MVFGQGWGPSRAPVGWGRPCCPQTAVNTRCLPSRGRVGFDQVRDYWCLFCLPHLGILVLGASSCPKSSSAPQARLRASCNPAWTSSCFSTVLRLLALWGVPAQLGTSRAFTGDEARRSGTRLTQGGAGRGQTLASYALLLVLLSAVKDAVRRALERRLASPGVGFAMLPKGCSSISILPASHGSSASAPALPAPRPVLWAPAPGAGRRRVCGAKRPGRASGTSVTHAGSAACRNAWEERYRWVAHPGVRVSSCAAAPLGTISKQEWGNAELCNRLRRHVPKTPRRGRWLISSCTPVSATGDPAHHPAAPRTWVTQRRPVWLCHCCSQDPQAHPWVPTSLAGALLGAAPEGSGAGDVWPARSLLPLMSPTGDKIAN